MLFLLLPTQLFAPIYLDRRYQYILWEHPHYFKKYNYNQKKLLLHKSSCLNYVRFLKQKKFKIKHIPYPEKFQEKKYCLFDPIDNLKLPGKPFMIDSPNFLLSKSLLAEYRQKTKKFFFTPFYMWAKKKLAILPHLKSQDKLNRKKLPKKKIHFPKLPSHSTQEKTILQKGTRFVKKHFSKNLGNTNNFLFPVSHSGAKKWLQHFLRHNIGPFGPYQDAMDQENSYLFHSVLSSSINIGLLNPLEIIKSLLNYPNAIVVQSLEGYVRQLFWREYQRYCFIYAKLPGHNFFNNRKKLSKMWYTGKTGILPVDTCILRGIETAYLNHIERLMIMGNFMNLFGLHPQEGFRWFMEFSCDSYEWVMTQNVLDMAFFSTGGRTMRRPYLSSSNYILKMSNYPRGEWTEEWDQLYHQFLKKHKKKLWKFRYYFRGLAKA